MPGPEQQSGGLERLERLFAELRWPTASGMADARASARRRAVAALDGVEPEAGPVDHVALLFAAELLASLGVELAARPARAAKLIARVEAAANLPRPALAGEVLRSPILLSLPPAVAVEVQLGLLLAFAPLETISLWASDANGAIVCLQRAGKSTDGPQPKRLARRVLGATAGPVGERGRLIGLPVERWQQPVAALIGRAQPRSREHCLPVMEEAVPMLSAIFERDDLLNRNVNAERTVVETYERRLTRLGYDVHDGPLQDLALLGEDVRLFRRQLAEVLPADVARLAMGRLDDLDAQLAALDSDLRVISASLQSPFTAHRTVTEALEFLIGAFAARTKVKPRLKLEGDLDDLTHSQEMAILSIVREALNNVREHSNASRVAVTVTGGPGTIDFRIVDDGVGFDVEATLIRAAREGRFGLVGLHERARLLGGQSRIDSRRGGPTTISVTLPRWRPVAGDAETRPGRST